MNFKRPPELNRKTPAGGIENILLQQARGHLQCQLTPALMSRKRAMY